MIYNCQNCNKEFKRSPGNIIKYKTNCCCKSCSLEYKEKHKQPKNCIQCGNPIGGRPDKLKVRKFCSQKCLMLNRTTTHKGLPEVQGEQLLCHGCMQYKGRDEYYDFNKQIINGVRGNKMRKCTVCWNSMQRQRSIEKRSTIQGTLEYILKRTKSSAKSRGLLFDLDIQYLLYLHEKQSGKCALSGMLMEPSTYYNLKTISLDRIDSSRGYLKDNVQLLCWIVNQMKNDLLTSDFIDWCTLISNNNNHESKNN